MKSCYAPCTALAFIIETKPAKPTAICGQPTMDIAITLPDDIAQRLQQQWGNLPNHMLEMLVVQAYESEAVTRAEVGQILGLASRFEVDAFLKQANAYLHYDEADFEQDMKTMEKLRNEGKLQQA